MTSEPLFVWIYLPGAARPVVAGRLEIRETPSGSVGHFVYGKSYLARDDAPAIDPVSLPVRPGEAAFTALRGIPGALLDACPDRWGIKVMDRLLGRQEFPLGYLLMNDPGRAGCLAFSRSATEAPEEFASGQYPLSDLLAAAQALERDESVAPELLKALHPGTGGARPKCNILDGEGVWIAKFPSVEDDPGLGIPRLEHAVMALGRDCGIQTAQTRILQVAGKDICLVRRFDRVLQHGQLSRRGFLSARTVFYADPGYGALATGSYGRLSRWMPRYGCLPAERRELFRRMVFNCLIRNGDDHELNHGLVHRQGDTFELSPAYDLVPELKPRRVQRHALLIGDSAAGTVANVVSNAQAFGLDREEALATVADMQTRFLDQWPAVLRAAGFGEAQLRRLEAIFQPLPLEGE